MSDLALGIGVLLTDATSGDSAFIRPSDIPDIESTLKGKACGRFEARKIGRTRLCAVPVISLIPRVILLSRENVVEITNVLRSNIR